MCYKDYVLNKGYEGAYLVSMEFEVDINVIIWNPHILLRTLIRTFHGLAGDFTPIPY